MKHIYIFIITIISSFILNSPGYGQAGDNPREGNAYFYDDFESYYADQKLACQNPEDWNTWNLTPCGFIDVYVSALRAHSGTKSFNVQLLYDEVHYWGPVTSGKWEIDFYNYIPAGESGYFNTLSQFIAEHEWGLDVFFHEGGAGEINAGGYSTATFTWTPDTWVLNQVIVDLKNDAAEYRYNDTLIYSWQWTLGAYGEGGALSLEASDFYGYGEADNMFVDDYQVIELEPVGLKSGENKPADFNLGQNYPNPFNPSTNISFTIPETGNIKLAVYNTLGQEVGVLVNGVVSAGSHQVSFDAKALPSGTYFYSLQSENGLSVKKMLLLK